MAYTGLTKSTFAELFTTLITGKTFKIAFYTEELDASTSGVYDTTNEFVGANYTAGGVAIALAATPIVQNADGVFIHFSNVTIANMTTGATPIKGFAIYDVTDDGVNPISNKVRVSGRFKIPQASTNGTFSTSITYQMAGVLL